MLKPLLIAALLTLAQGEKQAPEMGVIAGAVAAPDGETLSQPLQVVLLSPPYVELWETEVQRRLDGYWERFKPAFAQQKEIFVEATRMAYLESAQLVIARMRREIPDKIAALVQQSTAEGRFEFRNVPLGEYTVLAVGNVGDQRFVWQEPIQVTSPIPQFLRLKHRIP